MPARISPRTALGLAFAVLAAAAPAGSGAAGAAAARAEARPAATARKAPDRYLTGRELERIYRKKYADKLPYDFGYGVLTGVSFTGDGEVRGEAVIADPYFYLPAFVRQRTEKAAYDKYFAKYCRKVRAKKLNLHRVRRIVLTARKSSGEKAGEAAVSPEMCRKGKKDGTDNAQ